ncbi:MAG: hypothetical protein GQ559_08470 [Desulfobulbaceae bacterium]|nr:hypothetical protein [Desulfobulbaceae bacterium]
MFGAHNPYLPRQAVIETINKENDLVKTFHLSFTDELYSQDFRYKPGQFMMVSIPHKDEAPISFSSTPSRPGSFSLTIRNSGSLTAAIQRLKAGDIIGLRGPYGKAFPVKKLQGKNLLFVAGGIGMAPLRSVIEYCLDHPDDYGRITILYGCKHPGEIIFERDFLRWTRAGCQCLLTVDESDGKWRGHVGLVTKLLLKTEIDEEKDAALICGPGIMIRFVIERLEYLGYLDANIITTLERHMKCGIGICGHCHFEDKLVCADGPVFTRAELPNLENL